MKRNIIYNALKRIIDIVGDIVGILLFIPIFILVPLIIKFDSPGPVFYIQRRCGQNGREFKMYKFRSMVKDAEVLRAGLQSEVGGSVFKIENDPRVTRVGRLLRRTSIDELPQLFNVLKGDMSLVGPRPLSAEEMSGDKEWRELRLRVNPGITGLWQVKARDSRKFEDWIRYDTEYVINQSLFLDIKILLMTVKAVIRGRGAY